MKVTQLELIQPILLEKQGGDNQGNQGNHGKIRDLYNSGKVMEKSGTFIILEKSWKNHGIFYKYLQIRELYIFAFLRSLKKSSNRRYQMSKQEEKEMKQNLKRRKH